MDIKLLTPNELRALARAIVVHYGGNSGALHQKTGVSERTLQEIRRGRLPWERNAISIVEACTKDMSNEEVKSLITEGEMIDSEAKLRERALKLILESKLDSSALIAKVAAYEASRRLVQPPLSASTVRTWVAEKRLPQIAAAQRILAAFGETNIQPQDIPLDPSATKGLDRLTQRDICMLRAPVVGTVGASANGIVGEVSMQMGTLTEVAQRETCFRLEVRDDSMMPLVMPGQWVIFDTQLQVRGGDLAVLDVAEGDDAPELLFKRVRIDASGAWILESLRPGVKPRTLRRAPRAAYAVCDIQVRPR